MKKGVKIVASVLAVVLLLIIVAVLIISPIAKWYIESHSKDLIGRKVTIENLDLRLLRGQLYIDNMVLYEANDCDTFVALGHLGTDLQLAPLFSHSIIVDSINLERFDATVIRNRSSLNFDDIILHLATNGQQPVDTVATETPSDALPQEAESDWEIVLNNINLSQSEFTYDDRTMQMDWTLQDVGLYIPVLDLSGSGTHANLSLDFNSGGRLEVEAMYDRPTMQYDINCRLLEYPVSSIFPLVKDLYNLGSIEGALTFDLHADGDVNHILAFNLSGQLGVDKCNVTDGNGQQLIAVNHIKTDIERINIEQDYIVHIKEVAIDGLTTRYEAFADGSNTFSSLVESTPDTIQETVSDSIKIDLLINKLALTRGDVTYVDHTLPQPFSMHLSNIHVSLPNFSLTGDNQLDLFARVQETGSLSVRWKGNIDAGNHDLILSLNNFNLKDISPYTLAFFAQPMEEGKISFRGQNIIQDKQLRGTNHLSLYHPQVGKKDKTIKPEVGSLPLGLVFTILTDREDKAEFDLPVSGNIDSPEFSYKKILLQAIGNLCVKVVAAPIDFIAGLFGLNSNEVKEIKLNAWQREFTPEQYDKLEKLSTLIAEKSDMKVVLYHEINYEDGITAISENEFRKDFYLSQNPDKAHSLDLTDRSEYQQIELRGTAITQYADSLLTVRGLSTEGSLRDKIKRLYDGTADEKLLHNIAMRDRSMKMQWTRVLNMPEESLSIESPSLETLRGRKGKTRYKVEIVPINPDSTFTATE